MGTLNKLEIERLLFKGELIKNVRQTVEGIFDLQYASYDLMAGTVVWKKDRRGGEGDVSITRYNPGKPDEDQAAVTLHPGQMMFVITHEEVKIPKDLCGTVMSRNRLAKEGVLALNAGHIDPGFEGPILIRLISLRSTPWTMRLGMPIFTIVFHKLDVKTEDRDKLEEHPKYSKTMTLEDALRSAAQGLSNPLYDVNAQRIEEAVNRQVVEAEERLRASLSKEFITRSGVQWMITIFLGILVLLATLVGVWPQLRSFLGISR